jgi:mono/diheme cytochrome c family protein
MSASLRRVVSSPRRSLRDGHEGHEEPFGLRVLRDSCQAFVVFVILLALTAVVAAQVRPAPQPPPRRTAPPPKTAPQPKRGDSEPTDRGQQGSAPPASAPQQTAPTPQSSVTDNTPAGLGAALYKKNGCYECHVNDAQGGPQGPRLGPNPIPQPRFVAYVRNPAGDMPPFTAKVVSDDDLAKIYAFLQSRPMPPPVKDIPLLGP